MSTVGKFLSRDFWKNVNILKTIGKEFRRLSTASEAKSTTQNDDKTNSPTSEAIPGTYRYIYPEFLPDPSPLRRNALREKLERMDMMARRTVIDIPEFYVGSILAVTITEPHAPGKKSKFVGICVQREGSGLRANFTLRNVIDHQGIELLYNMYDPSILKIQCLRLEKRLDDTLIYLRDAPNEYSTVPTDMETELLPEDSPVPVNKTVVPLKLRKWMFKWEQKGFKGLSWDSKSLNDNRRRKAKLNAKPWEKYDLMKIYRNTIPEEEQQAIYSEIFIKLHSLEVSRKKQQRKRSFKRPKKHG